MTTIKHGWQTARDAAGLPAFVFMTCATRRRRSPGAGCLRIVRPLAFASDVAGLF